MRNIFDEIEELRQRGLDEEAIYEELLKRKYSESYIKRSFAKLRASATESQRDYAKALLSKIGFDLESREKLLRAIERADKKRIRAIIGFLHRALACQRAGKNLLKLLQIGYLGQEIRL